MSCGKPHETDCSEVLAEVWLFLDQECDGSRRELLARHLDECSPCLERYGIEEHLKALLARKCGGDHAPDTFKQRLRARIRESMIAQGEVTIERAPDGSSTVEVAGRRISVPPEGSSCLAPELSREHRSSSAG
ncbi:mycothiol system anti-sigma-R factor [Goodfellowiella coeruleoviolacea]|uniref:Mycothiol system anti-sigma-R factor n=1 Tax=Goodfellowiella coeruleoviolacea TaxID=334858 RepID=A0AAE3GL02_9PSEU|nr:mycothiol system anti-sigma-R factor [Goodfellowiella coeruleoviolacea]MCP2167983.1 mycothiol system anti-sigma-R factor [Goodfellowiella coeruleoviolacea]